MEEYVKQEFRIPETYDLTTSEYTSRIPEIPALDDRIVLNSELPQVFVFTRWLPTTRRAPYFFTTGISGELDDIGPIETILESVQTHLSPRANEAFTYGLQFADIQICGATPDRFLKDLEQFGPDRECSLAELGSYEPVHGHPYLSTAALWPLKNGWLYLDGGNLAAERQDWTIVLLFAGHPFDTTPFTAFFESFTEDPPDELWLSPLQTATGSVRSRPEPVPFIDPVGERLCHDRWHTRSRFAQAPNPLYNREQLEYTSHESGYPTSVTGQSLVGYITTLPTLLYSGGGFDHRPEENRYAVNEIEVVDAPMSRALFVRSHVGQ